MNPTGHAAIYLAAFAPTRPPTSAPVDRGNRRRPEPLSPDRWLRLVRDPVLAYLYAVDDAPEIPDTATPKLELNCATRIAASILRIWFPTTLNTKSQR